MAVHPCQQLHQSVLLRSARLLCQTANRQQAFLKLYLSNTCLPGPAYLDPCDGAASVM